MPSLLHIAHVVNAYVYKPVDAFKLRTINLCSMYSLSETTEKAIIVGRHSKKLVTIVYFVIKAQNLVYVLKKSL